MAAEDIYKAAGFAARSTIVTVKDVSAAEFIKAYAAHLKKNVNFGLPEWVDVVKTAHGRELAPYDEDWFYVRAASIARKVYLHDGLGVGALARWYGKAKTKGVKPKHHGTASRAIIRTILKQVCSCLYWHGCVSLVWSDTGHVWHALQMQRCTQLVRFIVCVLLCCAVG